MIGSFEVEVLDILEYPGNPPSYEVQLGSLDGPIMVHIYDKTYDEIANIALGSKYVISVNSRS